MVSSPESEGGGETRPFRIKLISQGPTPDDICERQEREAIKRGLPEITEQIPLHDRRLAVVGGGPSVKDRLDELRAFDEVWGINATADWLIGQGIDALFFTVDAAAEVVGMVGKAKRGIITATAHPSVFEALEDVRIFFMEHTGHPLAIYGGGTTAARAPMLALRLGFKDVSFFGCEGSFSGSTHLYRHEERDDQVIVRAGGEDYRTTPDFLCQCEYLADAIRTAPHVFRDCSGGLLTAMVAHWDTWAWAAVSGKYKDYLERQNGCSLFPEPYVRA